MSIETGGGEGKGFLFQSIDVTLDEYYTRRLRTRPNQRRLLDLEFIGRIQRMHEPWMPKPEAARVPPESTPSKPAEPKHNKILAIRDNMEKAFSSVEHLLESDKNELLEAAKGLIEWFKSNPKSKVGSSMRLVKAIREAIEAHEKEGGYR